MNINKLIALTFVCWISLIANLNAGVFDDVVDGVTGVGKWVGKEAIPTVIGKRKLEIKPYIRLSHNGQDIVRVSKDAAYVHFAGVTLQTKELKRRLAEIGCTYSSGSIVCAGSLLYDEAVRAIKRDPKINLVSSNSKPSDLLVISPLVPGTEDALDYCAYYAKDCGRAAALAYCKSINYSGVIDIAVRHNTPPTKTISGKEACTGSSCDRIGAITCTGPIHTYTQPKLSSGEKLDYCNYFGKGCGQDAAKGFCADKGQSLHSYKKQPNVGRTKTRSDNRICEGRVCDSFKEIQCVT